MRGVVTLAILAAAAIAGPAWASDLDEAYATCMKHKNSMEMTARVFDAGWDHCRAIEIAVEMRGIDTEAARDPGYARTVKIANELLHARKLRESESSD